MNINPVSIHDNLNSNLNFKGELCFDRGMYELCNLDEKYKDIWQKQLPENSAVVFNYYKGNKGKRTESYSYKLYNNIHNKPVKEGVIEFSYSPNMKYSNKNDLTDLLKNFILYMKNIFPND